MTKRFHYLCNHNDCDGEMLPMKNVQDESKIPVYPHKCNVCGGTKLLQSKYPRIVNDDVAKCQDIYI